MRRTITVMTVPMNLDVVTHEEGDDDNDDDFADDGYVVASKSSLSLYIYIWVVVKIMVPF